MKYKAYNIIVCVFFILINDNCYAQDNKRSCLYARRYVDQASKLSDSSQTEFSLYLKAIETCPNLTEAHINLGSYYLRTKQVDKALDSYKQALSYEDNSSIQKGLATTYLYKKNYRKAEIHFQSAIDYGNRQASTIEGLALALKEQGKLKESEKVLASLTNTDISDARTFYNKAIVYETNGKLKQARELYQNALSIDPKHWRSLHSLGRLDLQQKEYQQAEKHFSKALTIEPSSLSVVKSLASSLWSQKKFEEYENKIRSFIKQNPQHSEELQYSLGTALLKQKKYKDAEPILQKISKTTPSAKNLTSLAWAQIEQEKYSQAEANLRKALSLDNNYALAHNNLGVLYRRTDRLKKALYEFKIASRSDSRNSMFKTNYESLKKQLAK